MPRPKMIGPKLPCSVDGCDKANLARGYCGNHWALWRRHGTPTPVWPDICTVEGCADPVRSLRAGMCEKHYYRARRGKRVSVDPQPISGPCVIDGCNRPAEVSAPDRAPYSGDGICRMHMLRKRKRGDYSFEMRGENHPMWTGDDATNKAVHLRLRAQRGKAKSWMCVDCSCPALHWSYDHTDPDELHDEVKGPYSLDPDRYMPRCARCHKLFDLRHARDRAAA